MSPAFPPWIILPLALVAMLIVSAHVTLTQASAAPRSRKRLRIANGWVMLITLPLLAAGVSLVTPDRSPRLFVLTWIGVALLLTLSILLAMLDAANTVRLVRAEKHRQAIEFIKARYASDRFSSEEPPGTEGTKDAGSDS